MLTIGLEGPPRPFLPGDEVAGNVRLTGDSFAQKISVMLEGRAKTKIRVKNGNSESIYRGRALLLCDVQQPAAQVVPGSGQTAQVYSFRFTIPSTVQDTRSFIQTFGKQEWSGASYWDTWTRQMGYPNDPGHPLPPTFGEDYAWAGRYSRRAKFSVTYAVKAFASTGQSGEAQTEHPIRILMAPTPAEIFEDIRNRTLSSTRHFITIRTPRLLPENAGRDLKFGEKFKMFFGSEKIPSITFRARLTVPSHLLLGHPIPVTVKLEDFWPQKDSALPEEPVAELRSIDLTVKCETLVRAGGMFRDHDARDSNSTFWGSAAPSFSTKFRSSNDYELSWHSKPLPFQAPPTFATYNIKQQYALKVHFTVACAGEEEQFKVNVPIVLHPWSRPNSAGVNGSGDGESQQMDMREWGDLKPDDHSEDLPSYGEAVKK